MDTTRVGILSCVCTNWEVTVLNTVNGKAVQFLHSQQRNIYKPQTEALGIDSIHVTELNAETSLTETRRNPVSIGLKALQTPLTDSAKFPQILVQSALESSAFRRNFSHRYEKLQKDRLSKARAS
jgi:hypothetical protein